MTLDTMLDTTPIEPRVDIRDGRVVIDVHWDQADALRDHFRLNGLPGTVSLDPLTREACLELWHAPDVDRARAVLADWPR